MDHKTLQYMGDRVDRARKIIDQIEGLTKEVERVKRTYGIEVSTLNKGYLRVGTWDSKPIEDEFRAQLVASMVNVFIDLTLKEIRRLEQELAEL